MNPSALPSAWDLLTKIHDPMMPLSAAQVGALMGRRDLDLEYVEAGSPDFIPYEPSPLGRVFRLGDVLLALDPDAEIEGHHVMAREEAEAALAKRVGEPNPPDWFNPDDYPSATDAKQSRGMMDLILMGLTARPMPVMNPKGNPTAAKAKADAAARAAGHQVHRLRGFVSLADLVLNGHLDDEWIFAKRSGQRPYDFLDSLARGDGAPWAVLTLEQYLDEVRAAAQLAAEIAYAEAEADVLDEEVRNP